MSKRRGFEIHGASDDAHRRGAGRESYDARYRFNYSREEREARAGRRVPDKPGSFFSRHRGTVILLFDLMIIAVVFVVFRSFLMPEPHKEVLGGYEFELQAVADQDELVLRMRVVRRSEADAREERPDTARSGIFEVRVPADPEQPELVGFVDLLPTGERPRIHEERLARDAVASDTVTARVIMDEQEVTLSTRLPR